MNQKRKKGFTLIELLAVIVILAIIALIAVPVILNIIDKANKSAFKDTAYGIISAGELYFAQQQLELEGMKEEVTFSLPDTTNTLEIKGNVPTGSITITRDGDISLVIKNDRYCVTKGLEDNDITITDTPENCTVPSGGSGNQGTGGNTQNNLVTAITLNTASVSIINGGTYQIEATVTPTTALNKTLTYTSNNEDVATVTNTGLITGVAGGTATITVTTTDGSNISKTINITVNQGEKTISDVMVSTTNNCVTSGTCTEAEIKTDEGIKVTINVKEGTPKDFYVLADDGEKVTLIMSENLGANVAWHTGTGAADNSHGPTTALAALADRTNDWEIPEFTYQLNGIAENGTTRRYPDSQVTAKARLLTYAEANAVGCKQFAPDGSANDSCPDWMYANLNGTGSDQDDLGNAKFGYWTSTANYASNSRACNVYFDGRFNDNNVLSNYNGLRPVIELSK